MAQTDIDFRYIAITSRRRFFLPALIDFFLAAGKAFSRLKDDAFMPRYFFAAGLSLRRDTGFHISLYSHCWMVFHVWYTHFIDALLLL